MREAGRRLARILKVLSKEVRVGITTQALDDISLKLMEGENVRPAFLGYKPHGARYGYPASICTSVNDGVVHGLPSAYVIKDGDLVKIDIGAVYQGFYADMAVTIPVGKVSKEARKLVKVTRESLEKAIKVAKPGNTLGDIGHTVEHFVKRHGFGVVRALTGHGIGRALHEDPYVFNYGKPGTGEELRPGMVIAIEPMITLGKENVRQLKDDSFVTADGSLAAHFEHTVAITERGPIVLTKE